MVIKVVIKCPYCGYKNEIKSFDSIKSWKFRFYTVTMLECPKCGGIFNYYKGISPSKGTLSEFYVKIKPRNMRKKNTKVA